MRTALLVVHDVWGRTPALVAAAGRVASALGATAHVPDHLARPVPDGATDEDAYAQFVADVGVDALADRVAADATRLRRTHDRVLGLGYSVGASAVWAAAARGPFDAVVCVYGSRIRDRTATPPTVPCLALFAAEEPAFDPHGLVRVIAAHPTVTAAVVGGGHGFANPRTTAHDPALAELVEQQAVEFLRADRGQMSDA